jgi:putative ABC transport system permease protein
MILMVAIVAVASATAGPAYYSASKTSILHDTMASVPVIGRGYSVEESGSVNNELDVLAGIVASPLQPAAKLFGPPIEAIAGTVFVTQMDETIPLVWSSGVCAHLQIDGACPITAQQVMISRSLATLNGWRIGLRLLLPGWSPFTISGIYTPPSVPDDYWFDRIETYFAFENPPGVGGRSPTSTIDAMFTARATLQQASGAAQGTTTVIGLIDSPRLRGSEVPTLSAGIAALTTDKPLDAGNAVVTTEIPATLTTVHSAWSSLESPVFLITVQLLGLAWLLLFLLVTEAVGARGPEIALAKLRGYQGWRVTAFALSEPLALLAVAFPVGALTGWGISALLGRDLLRAGTPVGLPALGWAAAAAAVAGGLGAVIVASRRTLRRPVADQWRRASKTAGDRTWLVDAVLLTGAIVGLAELEVSGKVSSTRHSALSLLVPGLLGLAVAVVASRLLPLACRTAASRGRRFGGLAAFLALRHVARRPNGARTTIILATSFALATFAISAWLVDGHNYRVVATSEVGAPTVLTVTTPPAADLGALVSKADPSGRRAAAVDETLSSGTDVLGVDPLPWSHVVRLGATDNHESSSALAAALAPPAPPPLVLDGDAVRLNLVVHQTSPPATSLAMDVAVSAGSGATPVIFGNLPANGAVTFTAPLVGCPCTVEDFTAEPSPTAGDLPVQGTVVLEGLDVHGTAGWQPINPHFGDVERWQPAAQPAAPPGLGDGNFQRVTAAGTTLRWAYDLPGDSDATLLSIDRPLTLPAVVSAAVTGKTTGPFSGTGLNGADVALDVIATLAVVPGAPSDGVVVDRHYAELAADGNLSQITQQVWIGEGATTAIVAKLRAEGVVIVSAQREGDEAAVLRRQGPGLASVLFLAEGAAAALLAAGGALVGLYLSARRRRYELAALAATGLTRRTLLGAVVGEQLLVLGFGILAGIGTGLVAVAVALRDVPAFITEPTAPVLTYTPTPGTLTLILLGAAAAVLAATLVSCVSLVRGVRLDQLREAPA